MLPFVIVLEYINNQSFCVEVPKFDFKNSLFFLSWKLFNYFKLNSNYVIFKFGFELFYFIFANLYFLEIICKNILNFAWKKRADLLLRNYICVECVKFVRSCSFVNVNDVNDKTFTHDDIFEYFNYYGRICRASVNIESYRATRRRLCKYLRRLELHVDVRIAHAIRDARFDSGAIEICATATCDCQLTADGRDYRDPLPPRVVNC